MMTLAATFALADPPAKKLTDRTLFLPVRVGMRAVVRPGTDGALRFDAAVQLLRLSFVATELNVGFNTPTGLVALYDDDQTVWPRRQNAVSAGLDVLFEPSPFLGIGPSFDLDVRWYRQEWVTLSTLVVPSLGGVAALKVLRGPWYSLDVHAEARVDLTQTVFELAGLGSTRLSPVSLEIGLRFAFGHGRVIGRTRTIDPTDGEPG